MTCDIVTLVMRPSSISKYVPSALIGVRSLHHSRGMAAGRLLGVTRLARPRSPGSILAASIASLGASDRGVCETSPSREQVRQTNHVFAANRIVLAQTLQCSVCDISKRIRIHNMEQPNMWNSDSTPMVQAICNQLDDMISREYGLSLNVIYMNSCAPARG